MAVLKAMGSRHAQPAEVLRCLLRLHSGHLEHAAAAEAPGADEDGHAGGSPGLQLDSAAVQRHVRYLVQYGQQLNDDAELRNLTAQTFVLLSSSFKAANDSGGGADTGSESQLVRASELLLPPPGSPPMVVASLELAGCRFVHPSLLQPPQQAAASKGSASANGSSGGDAGAYGVLQSLLGVPVLGPERALQCIASLHKQQPQSNVLQRFSDEELFAHVRFARQQLEALRARSASRPSRPASDTSGAAYQQQLQALQECLLLRGKPLVPAQPQAQQTQQRSGPNCPTVAGAAAGGAEDRCYLLASELYDPTAGGSGWKLDELLLPGEGARFLHPSYLDGAGLGTKVASSEQKQLHSFYLLLGVAPQPRLDSVLPQPTNSSAGKQDWRLTPEFAAAATDRARQRALLCMLRDCWRDAYSRMAGQRDAAEASEGIVSDAVFAKQLGRIRIQTAAATGGSIAPPRGFTAADGQRQEEEMEAKMEELLACFLPSMQMTKALGQNLPYLDVPDPDDAA